VCELLHTSLVCPKNAWARPRDRRPRARRTRQRHTAPMKARSMAEINDFISDSDGLRLIGAFMRIDNAAVRRRIVKLVEKLPVTTATRMPNSDWAGRT
jgi:hypothetical protein